MQERHKSGRSRALKEAKLFFGSSSMIDCVVHNFTDAGARVEIPNTVELPEAFGLTFDGGYSLRPCRIVWRTSNETGVEFL
jgi:PilZ domain